MITKYHPVITLFALLFTGAILFSCGGQGGDKKDHLRKEHGRDPEGFKKKWGV
jgi:hypothetical protein